MKAQSIEIRLLGQRIALKTAEGDPEQIQQVVDLVTSLLKQAEGRSPKGSAPHHVTLVALMDLASEYVKAKKRTIELKNRVEEKSQKLLGLLEAQ